MNNQRLSKFAAALAIGATLIIPLATFAETGRQTEPARTEEHTALKPLTPLKPLGKLPLFTNASGTNPSILKQRTGSFNGQVTAVNGTSFTLQTKEHGNQTVNTTGSTVFKKSGATASIADILSGENATVSGLWDKTASTVAASMVNIIVRTTTVTGTISQLSGNTITIVTSTSSTGTTYSVDASSAKLMRLFGAAMQIGDFQVNDKITVNGTIVGNNISAKTIRDLSLQARSGTFKGNVSAISGTSFTLQSKERGNQTINTSSTTVFNLAEQKVLFSSLAVGELLTVAGVWDRTNSNVTAKKITIQISRKPISAVLQSLSGTTLIVTASSTTYTVDASKAKFSYKNGRKADITILQTNDQLKISGWYPSGTTNVTASEITDISKTYTRPSTTPEHSN